MIEEKNLYNVKDYAEISGIPEQSVTRMIRNGKLKAQMISGRYKIPRSEIEKLLMIDGKTASLSHFETTRELEIENKALRTQLELLKNILGSASNILNSDM
jgi:excisionase family DNA binding protein